MSDDTPKNNVCPAAKPLPYRWGRALAVFDAIIPGGLSPMAMTSAVERPLLSLANLGVKAAASHDHKLKELLVECMGEVDDLPKQMPLERQGEVYLGYYSLRGSLPPSPPLDGKVRPDWESVDWSKTDAEIASILVVSRSAVAQQRRKRNPS